jgi:hypothetical protein
MHGGTTIKKTVSKFVHTYTLRAILRHPQGNNLYIPEGTKAGMYRFFPLRMPRIDRNMQGYH